MEVSQSPSVLRGDDPRSNGAVHLKLPVMAARTEKAARAQLRVTTRRDKQKGEEGTEERRKWRRRERSRRRKRLGRLSGGTASCGFRSRV